MRDKRLNCSWPDIRLTQHSHFIKYFLLLGQPIGQEHLSLFLFLYHNIWWMVQSLLFLFLINPSIILWINKNRNEKGTEIASTPTFFFFLVPQLPHFYYYFYIFIYLLVWELGQEKIKRKLDCYFCPDEVADQLLSFFSFYSSINWSA